MKFLNFGLFLAACTLACTVFADAGDTLITFSTKEPQGDYRGDTYADGSVAADGEWYALCWSPTETFQGVTIDGAAKGAGERVLLMAPLAKGGHCPTVVFQVAAATAPVGGNYFVLLLDTRDISGKVSAANAAGLPAVLNGSVATSATAAGGAAGSVGEVRSVADATAGAAEDWSASEADVAVVGQPVIKAFVIAGDKAFIKVGNMHASLRYNVMTGETPADLTTTALELPISAEKNDVEFVVPASKGKFFKVARQPIK